VCNKKLLLDEIVYIGLLGLFLLESIKDNNTFRGSVLGGYIMDPTPNKKPLMIKMPLP
jgi:hypothetical protein